MKLNHLHYLIAAILVAGRAAASDRCAEEQCSIAQKMHRLPQSVRTFVSQRDGCDHWRGEPTEFDESYLRQAGEAGHAEQKERYEHIQRNVVQLCKGTDKSLAKLKHQYAGSRFITEFLNKYEPNIEPELSYTQPGVQADRP